MLGMPVFGPARLSLRGDGDREANRPSFSELRPLKRRSLLSMPMFSISGSRRTAKAASFPHHETAHDAMRSSSKYRFGTGPGNPADRGQAHTQLVHRTRRWSPGWWWSMGCQQALRWRCFWMAMMWC